MSGSTIYNHRSLQPTALAHGHSDVANTLDAMKQENLVTNKLYQDRTLRDEYESKVDTPIIRRTVDELEAQNGKVHQRNEDLLSAELHQLPGPGIHVHSLEGFRERERLGERSGERDQEREPLERNGERDPKRLKIRDTCGGWEETERREPRAALPRAAPSFTGKTIVPTSTVLEDPCLDVCDIDGLSSIHAQRPPRMSRVALRMDVPVYFKASPAHLNTSKDAPPTSVAKRPVLVSQSNTASRKASNSPKKRSAPSPLPSERGGKVLRGAATWTS
ncbi:hypothetical protein B0H14DRAFT_3501104 [Mycena olivaceomarginata]|nr:hypothetical protein B0H14DRAFT_3501104 [Mycena olivaceomarginata]